MAPAGSLFPQREQPRPVKSWGWSSNTQDEPNGACCVSCYRTPEQHQGQGEPARWSKSSFIPSSSVLQPSPLVSSLPPSEGRLQSILDHFQPSVSFSATVLVKCSSICRSSEKLRDPLQHFQYNEHWRLEIFPARIVDLSDQLAAISAGVPRLTGG